MTVDLKKEITPADVTLMKLKCGLEIHQQLEGRKLFCRSPTMIRDDDHDYEIKRILRASAGESGIIDKAAAAEQRKQKYNVYQGYNDTIGLVEWDEEPPAPVSKKALLAAVQTAKLLDMRLIDQVRFMRKTVVDGSNTSGFQRTGLVAVNGTLKGKGYEIDIDSLCLEEDACKKIESTKDAEVYNLSRLGIPLVEIATGPDITSPEMAKEVAEQLGMVLRSLPNVKRGLGTIRQDVNVSIAKGVRVEIKGAQDLRMVPDLVRSEMLRQHNLLVIFEELKKRESSMGDMIDVTEILTTSESKVVQRGLDVGGVALALHLKGFKGILGLEIQPGRRYGSELSDYAKVMGVRGLFHSDELPNYGITQNEKDAVARKLGLGEQDAFILIIERGDVAHRAMNAVIDRASDMTLRKEVRTARVDGATTYMRPMPGAARMYPETDVEPVIIDKNVEVPQLLSERIEEIRIKHNLAHDIVKRMLKDGIDMDKLAKKYDKIKPAFIVDIYYSLPSMIQKKHGKEVQIEHYAPILLEKLNEGLITKDAIEEIVIKLSSGKEVVWGDYKPLSTEEIETKVRKLILQMKDKPIGAIMGHVMGEFKGKIDGKELSDLVMKIVKSI